MKRGNRAGNRFDVFQAIASGPDTSSIPSNDEIRKRNLEEFKKDAAAEVKAREEAAAIAQRNAEESALGISGMMQKAREHDARENETIRKRWAHTGKSIENFLAFDPNDKGGNVLAHSYYDRFHTLPHAESEDYVEPSVEEMQKVQRAENDFVEWLEVEGVILDDDSRLKVRLYIGVITFVDEQVDPRLSSCWKAAYERLANELQVLNVTRKPEPTAQAKPEITDRTTREQDAAVVFDDLVDVGGNLFAQWLLSLEQNFSFRPSKEQRNAAVSLLEHRQLPLHAPASFDIVRASLVRQHVWPEKSPSGNYLLTKDERISDLTEKYQMSDPAQRRAFFAERNRILFDTE